MIAKTRILIFILLGICASAEKGLAQVEGPDRSGFADADVQKKCNEIGAEQRHFRETMKQMIAIVDSDADPMVRQLAASTLREFRAVEAIPVLVRNLTNIGEIIGGGRNMVPGISRYTCALALYDIGPAAVDPLIWFIRGDANPKQIEVAACTISAISGKKRAVAILRANVEEDAADETRQRLYTAVKAVDALP